MMLIGMLSKIWLNTRKPDAVLSALGVSNTLTVVFRLLQHKKQNRNHIRLAFYITCRYSWAVKFIGLLCIYSWRLST